eukprot:TRINITY_DN13302_c0_g1_i5.p1 TRINITY_DN13302_c0_g1~~TRINITY_DN13302_c0_g1_i5.p1  ORF type:complete len:719 (-),score=182.08 TRINITY_DN13302_c0_g1_i5:260-2416(-)
MYRNVKLVTDDLTRLAMAAMPEFVDKEQLIRMVASERSSARLLGVPADMPLTPSDGALEAFTSMFAIKVEAEKIDWPTFLSLHSSTKDNLNDGMSRVMELSKVINTLWSPRTPVAVEDHLLTVLKTIGEEKEATKEQDLSLVLRGLEEKQDNPPKRSHRKKTEKKSSPRSLGAESDVGDEESRTRPRDAPSVDDIEVERRLLTEALREHVERDDSKVSRYIQLLQQGLRVVSVIKAEVHARAQPRDCASAMGSASPTFAAGSRVSERLSSSASAGSSAGASIADVAADVADQAREAVQYALDTLLRPASQLQRLAEGRVRRQHLLLEQLQRNIVSLDRVVALRLEEAVEQVKKKREAGLAKQKRVEKMELQIKTMTGELGHAASMPEAAAGEEPIVTLDYTRKALAAFEAVLLPHLPKLLTATGDARTPALEATLKHLTRSSGENVSATEWRQSQSKLLTVPEDVVRKSLVPEAADRSDSEVASPRSFVSQARKSLAASPRRSMAQSRKSHMAPLPNGSKANDTGSRKGSTEAPTSLLASRMPRQSAPQVTRVSSDRKARNAPSPREGIGAGSTISARGTGSVAVSASAYRAASGAVAPSASSTRGAVASSTAAAGAAAATADFESDGAEDGAEDVSAASAGKARQTAPSVVLRLPSGAFASAPTPAELSPGASAASLRMAGGPAGFSSPRAEAAATALESRDAGAVLAETAASQFGG